MRPRVPKVRPKVSKGSPREAQSEPKGAKREPKGAEREPKGRPKSIRMLPKVCLREGFGGLSVCFKKSGLILVTFLMKKTIKKRCARTLYSSTRKLMKIRCKNSVRIKRKNDFFRFFSEIEIKLFRGAECVRTIVFTV